MAVTKAILEKWMVAQKRHRLSDKQVQMARELGLNPDKLGKIDNHRQESWKAPLPQFIESIYFKRFKREEPETVKPLKQIMAEMEAKKKLGSQFAQVVYEGKWETPLREALQAFVEKTQEYVTGEVKFRLYKGNIIKAGTTSPYSLYNESIASFKTGDMYDHHDADGFITLFGLPLKVRAMKMQELEKNNNK